MSAQKTTNDLLALARDFAAQNLDPYTLLKIPASATDQEITRGWRKQNLYHHPDKTRDAFDPEAYERIGNAKDLLLDPAARAAYDQARGAALLRQQEKERLGRDQRRYVDELEAAERDARRRKVEEEERRREFERERERLREEGVKRREEEVRLERERREEEAKGPSLDEQEAELLKKIEAKARRREEKAQRRKEKAERKGDREPKVSSYYFSTDPKLSYEEKVVGVMAKLRARQKERDERRQRSGDVEPEVSMES